MGTVAEGEILWEPSAEQQRAANMYRYSRWLGERVGQSFATYNDLWRWSVDNLDEFWASVWDHYGVAASKPYREVLVDRGVGGGGWFPGAELNYAEHALRHDADGRALVFVSEDGRRTETSREELRAKVGAFAATLRDLGVERGDRVAAYIPNIPEAIVAFLGCASIGAVWSSCSPDFGTRSVVDRFRQIEPKALVAVDGYRYGGKAFDRTGVVAELRASMPSVDHVIAVPHLDPGWAPDDSIAWDRAVSGSAALEFEQVAFDHPLWILYSSGTTGIPKGIVHGHGGVVLASLAGLNLHFDLGADDTFFWFTTTGWVMWNVVVSSLMLGCTAVLYDGSPGHPDAGRLWQIAADTETTVFGMSAAYITGSEKAGVEPAKAYDLSRLRAAQFTGSPLAPQGYTWVYEHVDPDIWFASVSGGTDVCGALVGGNPTLPVRAGENQCRALGVNVQAFDENGRPLIDEVGELVVTDPMPSMPLYLWGDADGSRYDESYFATYPGVWRHGDWLKITPHGSAVIYGRSDSTINRMGVRMGSAEIYGAVEELPEVLESLVVDLTYQGRSSWMPLFVVLRDGVELDDGLTERIKGQVRAEISPRHVPDEVVAVPEIPKTLNNKKLEVPVRKILLGASPEDVISRDSMSNPDALDHFIRLASIHFEAR